MRAMRYHCWPMANQEHLDILAKGIGGWNVWRKEANRVPDLQGADLYGADLHGADLRDALLGGANMRGASLWDANLLNADLRGADMRGADLTRAALNPRVPGQRGPPWCGSVSGESGQYEPAWRESG